MVWYGWYGFVWFGKNLMVWYGLIWFGMVWYDLLWYGFEVGGGVECMMTSEFINEEISMLF